MILMQQLGKKIRTHRSLQPAYIVVIGEEEKATNTVSIRARSGIQESGIPIDDFIEKITDEIERKMSIPSIVADNVEDEAK